MQMCLLKHLQEHFPISDNQWGFSKGKSTIEALLIAVDNNFAWYRLYYWKLPMMCVLSFSTTERCLVVSASQTAYG